MLCISSITPAYYPYSVDFYKITASLDYTSQLQQYHTLKASYWPEFTTIWQITDWGYGRTIILQIISIPNFLYPINRLAENQIPSFMCFHWCSAV